MKTILFDPAGKKLWAAISPKGLYAISFTLCLLQSDNVSLPPFILNEPAFAGDNQDGAPKYFFPVVNQFQPGEPLSKYDGRYASATFFIKTVADDDGYIVTVELLQGDDAASATSLGSDSASGTAGANGYAEVEIKFQLSKQ